MVRLAALSAALLVSVAAGATEPAARHGISVFGDLKYGAGFRHFDYVNPDAPKGGTFRLWAIDSFDNLNGYILKGVKAAGLFLTVDTLMTRAMSYRSHQNPESFLGIELRMVPIPARMVETGMQAAPAISPTGHQTA